MVYSMTGYGRTEKCIHNNLYAVEIKSLNGKQMDMRLNIPSYLKPYEIEIRSLLATHLIRGSAECIITLKNNGAAKAVALNTGLIKSFYLSLKSIAEDLHMRADDLLPAILKLPDVVTNNTEQIADAEWLLVKELIIETLEQLSTHRRAEGAALEKDLLQRVANIEQLETQNAALAPARTEKTRAHLIRLLEENVGTENYDGNRLEQELLYYIEKMDISEEQVRLRNHCAYFRDILQEEEISKGKKLSFLLQEFGREINTTGSKANDVLLQKNVVLMKDELEKAKEQVLNVL